MISKIFCTKAFDCCFKTLLLETKILRSELSVLSFCRLNKEYRHPVEWPLRSSLTLLPYFGAKLKQSLWKRGGRLSFHKRNTSKIILLNSTEEGRTGVPRSLSSPWSKLNWMKCKLILRTSLHCEHHHQFSWQSVCFSHAYQRVSTHTFFPAFTFYKIKSRWRCFGSGKKRNGQKFQMNGQKPVCFSYAYQRVSTHYFLPAFIFYPIHIFQ